mgnify:CR=1 FL=1
MATKKVIGYQITNMQHEVPEGLFSFQIFKTTTQAYKYAREHGLKGGLSTDKGWFVQQIREGDIENPTYIGGEKKRYNVTFYYHTNLTVSVEAESKEEALALAESEVVKESYIPQMLEGLVEDSSPDIEVDEK